MISAVIVGSSMIVQTNMKPHLWGVPLLGIFGFLMAALFGLWLIIYIVRTERYDPFLIYDGMKPFKWYIYHM
jgi:ubiquinone biosynthesis protein